MKKRYLFLIILVCLFAISTVSAEEIGNETDIVVNSDDSGLMAESVNDDLLTDSYGTFQELQNEIDAVGDGGTLNLTRNYKYVNGSTEGISITKPITIDGQGHTIDGNGQSRIFYIYIGSINLNNITFKNGYATYGGAISSRSDYVIKDSIFINNSALEDGGALYSKGFGQIDSCNFIKNNAIKTGGAINSYFNNVEIKNSYFEDNSALGDGGAIGFHDGKSSIFNSTFKNNLANTGGALYWYDTQLTIVNSTFFKNSAWERGGAIHCRGYNSKILNCDFINNTAELAGAISLDSPNCLVDSSNFINNSVIRYGGAFWWYGINGIINNCYFEDNVAEESGKSIYWSGGNGTIMNSYFNKKNTIYTRSDVKLINLTEIGLPIELHVDNIEKYFNSNDIEIIVKLTDENSNPLPYRTIKFELNNNTYSKSTNKNGYAVLYIKLDVGFYNMTTSLMYPGDYNNCIVNSTILIKSTILSNNVFNDSKFSAKFLDSFGKNLVNMNIDFYVNGSYYSSGITDDKGNIEINFYLPEGKYLIGYINPVTTEKKFNYIQIFNKTIFLANDVVKYFGGNEKFKVELFKNDKTPIVNTNIKININGQTYIRTTDINGQASMAINLNSGIYNVTSEYNGTKVNSTITVKSTVSGNNVTKIFKNATQYYATFVDTKGNLMKNTDVKFNINGVFYTRITNDKGVAKMNINLPPKPEGYIITAENPNSTERYTNLIKVLPSIVENYDLTKYYKNASKYTLRVIGDNGKPVGEGVTVKLNINGVFYERKTNASGYMSMNINLPPGKYTVTAEYNGLKASNTITVLSILETKDLPMKYKDGSKFEAKVLDGQGKPYAGQTVTFNINGVFYNRVSSDDGIARLSINLMAGEYIITTTFNGLNAANKVTIGDSISNLKSPEEQYKDLLGPNGANGYVYYPDGTYEHFVNDIVVDSNHYVDKTY